MTTSPVGMAAQGRAERDKFENELKRIIKASDEDLSPRALKIKRQVKAKLAEQPAAA